MDNEILEIIKKNIPAQTADVLSTYLSQAKNNEKELASQAKLILNLQEDIKKKSSQITELERDLTVARGECDGWKAKKEELDLRESQLFKNELEKKVFMLECQNVADRLIIDRDLQIMNTVFRNPRYVHSTHTNEEVPVLVPQAEDKYGSMRPTADLEKTYVNKTVSVSQEIE